MNEHISLSKFIDKRRYYVLFENWNVFFYKLNTYSMNSEEM